MNFNSFVYVIDDRLVFKTKTIFTKINPNVNDIANKRANLIKEKMRYELDERITEIKMSKTKIATCVLFLNLRMTMYGSNGCGSVEFIFTSCTLHFSFSLCTLFLRNIFN